ncbi:MAG: reverse transcriptase domain-containing protein [Solidesulfovibrio sp. DCME]|uniref:reverse transcriptase domain-containing protein n=1 Tax=Solidesulfovibrio sp. DCME TaxID=3447380 RepID=UPI003D0F560A
MELLEGKMQGTSSPENISTRLQKVAELAKQAPDIVFTTLAHHVDVILLKEAFHLTRKDGASGVDQQTAAEYEGQLDENLTSLLDRFKSGTYKAPPVKRAYIPKASGAARPIGIPTIEDKVLQRAVAMVLGAVYEQDFLPCSYGFRPGRSCHQALETLWRGIMGMRGRYVYEVDIRKFFDTLDHGHR